MRGELPGSLEKESLTRGSLIRYLKRSVLCGASWIGVDEAQVHNCTGVGDDARGAQRGLSRKDKRQLKAGSPGRTADSGQWPADTPSRSGEASED